jgi:hypothetical protein
MVDPTSHSAERALSPIRRIRQACGNCRYRQLQPFPHDPDLLTKTAERSQNAQAKSLSAQYAED